MRDLKEEFENNTGRDAIIKYGYGGRGPSERYTEWLENKVELLKLTIEELEKMVNRSQEQV